MPRTVCGVGRRQQLERCAAGLLERAGAGHDGSLFLLLTPLVVETCLRMDFRQAPWVFAGGPPGPERRVRRLRGRCAPLGPGAPRRAPPATRPLAGCSSTRRSSSPSPRRGSRCSSPRGSETALRAQEGAAVALVALVPVDLAERRALEVRPVAEGAPVTFVNILQSFYKDCR